MTAFTNKMISFALLIMIALVLIFFFVIVITKNINNCKTYPPALWPDNSSCHDMQNILSYHKDRM